MKEYLSSLKRSFVLAIILFSVAIILGYFMGGRLESLWSFLKDYIGGFPRNSHTLFLLILANNSIKAFLAMVLGVFFGIVPIFFVAVNGLVIGVVSFNIAKTHGFYYLILGILPHGVIEVPTILLSAGIGIKLGYQTYKKITSKEGKVKEELRSGLNLYVLLILPLLFLAALIESFLTPLLIA